MGKERGRFSYELSIAFKHRDTCKKNFLQLTATGFIFYKGSIALIASQTFLFFIHIYWSRDERYYIDFQYISIINFKAFCSNINRCTIKNTDLIQNGCKRKPYVHFYFADQKIKS